MGIPAHDLQLSPDEYLELEESAVIRHEYVRGRIFAMTGATEAHNAIVSNLHLLIGSKIRGSGCRSYVNDMKVKVEATNSIYYPDLMVTCESFSAKSLFKLSPCLIIEVLSPSTADIDCREKLMAYQTISALIDYAIVYQDQRRVELYHRQADAWTVSVFVDRDSFVLNPSATLPVTLSLDEIYDGIIDITDDK
jgi:Uma2 family endonuclease